MKKFAKVTKLIVGCLMLLFVCSGCVGVIRLIDKPITSSLDPGLKASIAEKKPSVCIIVKDERPELIQTARMCGTTHLTLFYIPAGFSFLAHKETLDRLVAYHVKKSVFINFKKCLH